MSEKDLITQEKSGTITFANDVLEIIVGVAASDISGVAGMSGGIKDGIVEMLGRKNFTKGIKVSKDEQGIVSAEIQIIVDYGVKVPEVCANIQNSVATALETMTGLPVGAINILVQGVRFKEEEKPALEEEEND
ncbi:Asp23/Gls24 family envelope stress response protein [Christensenellaceae bacterium 44-20]